MKKMTLTRLSQGLRLFVMFILATATAIPSSIAHADTTNKLYIITDAGSSSVQMNIGSTITMNVKSYSTTSQTPGTVSGTISYPSNQLKVLGTPTDKTVYTSPQINTNTPGVISFSASRNPGAIGTAQIFAITFQAVGAGNAAATFDNTSTVNSSTTGYSSATFAITDPNPPAPNQPVSTPKSVSTPKPSTILTPSPTPIAQAPVESQEPVATPDPTGLIDTVTIDSLYSSATVTWKVNASGASSTLTYGKSASKLDTNATVTKNADGSFTTVIKGLTPGVRYYFSITAAGDGGKTGNYSGNIITRGFPVILTVTENNIAAKGAQVKIGNRSYTTTADGKLSIGLASGSYSGTITTDTSTLSINLTVEAKTVPSDDTAPASQSFAFNLTSSALAQGPGSTNTILAFIGALVGGTLLLGVGFLGFMAYRRRKFESSSSSGGSSSTVIIDDGYDWRGAESVSQPPLSPQTPLPPTEPSASSVHLSDDEPLDMFDRAAELPLPRPQQSFTSPEPNGSEQTPNLPHSTTP